MSHVELYSLREFRLLGPLEVYVGGYPAPIASPRQRVLLVVLLMSRGHVVTVDMLIDAVWDGEPPSSARGQVQICISALRRAIDAPGLIETVPDGYRIRAQAGQLDCDVFDTTLASAREAMARGNPQAALENFDLALGLWHGPALAGVPGRAAAALANRLEERRVTAIEDRIETLFALGKHRELTGELVALTSRYPLRERLWGFRMIALYRSGRQADALAAYQEARHALIGELGLEPGECLIGIERAILSHDLSLDPADGGESSPPPRMSRPPRQLPADTPHFVGHHRAVEELRTALAGDGGAEAAGGARLAVIAGPAGSGKTTVALHAAHLVRGLFPAGQLFANLRGSSASPVPAGDVVAAFLRALGIAADAVPADADERISLLRSCLASRRLLIVLDDAGDERQVTDLLSGVPGNAVLVTSRSRLAVTGARAVDLRLLSEAESAELLERMVGSDRLSADEASGLARMCGGLPLALHIAGTRLAARPYQPAAALIERLGDERHRLDELSHGGIGVRPLLTAVHDSLSVPARKLFRLLSVVEFPDFSPLVAAAVLDCDLARAARVLDELSDAWLLQPTPAQGSIRYSFQGLTRIFAREQFRGPLDGECRQAIERVFGCLLAVAWEAHGRAYGGGFALLRGRSPRWPGTVPCLDRLLRGPLAWFEAEYACLRAAVQQADDLGLDEFCWELTVVSATFCEYRGLFDEWLSMHMTALHAVRSAGNRRGQGAVLVSLCSPVFGWHFACSDSILLETLECFELIGDELGQALCLHALARRDRTLGYSRRAVQRYERALTGFRAVGDQAAQTSALSGLARAHLDLGELDRAETLARKSLKLSERIPCRRLQAQALRRLGEVLLAESQLLAAKAVFQESLQIAWEEGDRTGETYTLNSLGCAALEMGDLDSAEIHLTQALDLCDKVHDRNIKAHIIFGMARICEQRSEQDRAKRYYIEAANSFAAQENTAWHHRAMDALLHLTREAPGSCRACTGMSEVSPGPLPRRGTARAACCRRHGQP
jgi:DNA-binding SARP family transcriptional activator